METMHGILSNTGDGFTARLERARSEGRALLDLTESDPERCGLAWDRSELDAIVKDAEARAEQRDPDAAAAAREAVASYLAGAGVPIQPDRVRFTRSRRDAYVRAFQAACRPGDEVIIPFPIQPLVSEVAATESLRVSRCALQFDGAWHLDRRSVENAVTRRTRAIVIGNPSEPSGALLRREELAFLEQLCARNASALISDEAFAGTARRSWVSALEATRCLTLQISGLDGICGLPRIGAAWYVVAGPEELASAAVSRLDSDADEANSTATLLSISALLARRERFLCSLRERLAANRALLAAGAVRESPWSLLWGSGGCWAVLEIGTAEPDEAICLALLDDGVAVQPGSSFGLPSTGYVVVSLLPSVDVFREALARLDRRLRGPLIG